MRTGFTCGAFDLLHAGHILMLEDAKKKCDYLFVGLQSDPSLDRPEKNRPIQSLNERLIQLRAVKYVDAVVIYDKEVELAELLKALNPSIRIIGIDHKDKPFTGHDLPIEIYFNVRDHGFSSTELRNRIKNII